MNVTGCGGANSHSRNSANIMCCGVISLVGVVQTGTSNGHNPQQMQFVTLSPSYEVYGDSFLPRALVQDAGVVAQDVYSPEGVCSFLKGSLRAENNNN